MKILKKKVLIFDLDGVLLDSSINMKLSWEKVQNKFDLEDIKFGMYFKHIGRPFFDILSSIGIHKQKKKIYNTYKNESIKQIKKVTFYKDTIKVLQILKKNKFIMCIVTSKDTLRTKMFLKNNSKFFKYIQCQDTSFKGKPYPDKINYIINTLNLDRKNFVYIGDTNIDYKAAKNSKIDFIHATWGYGKKYNYKFSAHKIADLTKIIKFNKNIVD